MIVILCLAGGMLFYRFSPKKFESKMIIQSDALSESYSFKLANKLNEHIYNHDTDYLSSKLNLTPEETKLLLGFEMVLALPPTSQLMNEKEKIIIVIVVRVSDNAILPKLEKGIIQYLSTNDYVKKRVEENKKYFESVIASYDRELKIMDTLKIKILKGKYSSSKDGGALIMDLGNLFETAGDLSEKKYSAERLLARVESIQVIEGLTPYKKPIWPKLSIVLLTSLVLAIAIISLIITIRNSRNQKTLPAA